MPPVTRDLEVAGADRLVGEPDRPHARGADLVDRLRGDLLRDPGLDLRLARGDLALAGLQHLAEDDLLDLLGRRPRRARARPRSPSPPSSVASLEASAPPIFPNGVRAVPRMTVWDIGAFLCRAGGEPRRNARQCSRCARSIDSPAVEVEVAAAPSASSTPTGRGRRSPTARAAGRARRRPGRRRREAGASRSSPLLHPERPDARAGRSGSATAEDVDAERLRVAAALAAKRGRGARGDARSPGLVPAGGDAAERAAALVEGTILAAYRFDRYRSARRRGPAAAAARAPGARRRRATPRRSSAEARVALVAAPRPPTAPASCRTCPRTSSPPSALAERRARDRRRARARSRSRSSTARRSPSAGWAACVAVSTGQPRPSRG